MKKSIFIFAVIACFASCLAHAAVNIKKASPVATKKTDAIESTTSLLPTVIGLVSNVKTLSTQQQALTADCAPTTDEVRTVNDLVKEWAKIGDTSVENAKSSSLGDVCPDTFEAFVKFDPDSTCYETFKSENSDAGMIWEDFPKASYYNLCDDSGKNCQPKTNIYDVFGRISLSDEDYTQAEAKKIASLKEKAQRCAPEKIKAAKRELYGGFLTQTLSSVGQSSGAAGTSAVMDAVSSMGGSSDIKSMLPSLGQMALQGLDK